MIPSNNQGMEMESQGNGPPPTTPAQNGTQGSFWSQIHNAQLPPDQQQMAQRQAEVAQEAFGVMVSNAAVMVRANIVLKNGGRASVFHMYPLNDQQTKIILEGGGKVYAEHYQQDVLQMNEAVKVEEIHAALYAPIGWLFEMLAGEYQMKKNQKAM